MASCAQCGAEITFRVIGGRTIPMGCSCRSSGGASTASEPDRSWKTSCPKCSAQVYFVQHNGGSMWFDELGPPWDRHSCFAAAEKDPGVLDLFQNASFPSIATISRFEKSLFPTEQVVGLNMHGQGHAWILPQLEFWEADPTAKVGDLVGVHDGKRMIELQNGRTYHFQHTTLNRCSRCGHWITSAWHHRKSCDSGGINNCGICGEQVHWSGLEAHVRSHGIER